MNGFKAPAKMHAGFATALHVASIADFQCITKRFPPVF